MAHADFKDSVHCYSMQVVRGLITFNIHSKVLLGSGVITQFYKS